MHERREFVEHYMMNDIDQNKSELIDKLRLKVGRLNFGYVSYTLEVWLSYN